MSALSDVKDADLDLDLEGESMITSSEKASLQAAPPKPVASTPASPPKVGTNTEAAPAVKSPRGRRWVAVLGFVCLLQVVISGLLLFGGSPLVPSQKPMTKAKDVEAIKELIRRYFSTWSNQNMKGYDECFLRDANIQFVHPDGTLTSYNRKDFIAEQTDYHKNAVVRATEVPESIDVAFEGKLARVVVFWKLTAGARTETGYDHFTLVRSDGNWLIVNLSFYASAKLPSE